MKNRVTATTKYFLFFLSCKNVLDKLLVRWKERLTWSENLISCCKKVEQKAVKRMNKPATKRNLFFLSKNLPSFVLLFLSFSFSLSLFLSFSVPLNKYWLLVLARLVSKRTGACVNGDKIFP